MTEEVKGREVASCQILDLVGQGGMGAVYRAKHLPSGRIVALKVPRNEIRGDSEAMARFRDEGETCARASHPNIIKTYSYGQDQGLDYIVMELVEGRPVSMLLGKQGNQLPLRRALEITYQCADALAALHALGIVHSDVKPANTLLDNAGQVKMMDFGIARQKSFNFNKAEMENAWIGTPSYVAPEKFDDPRGNFRTDIYALGVMLFEMLAGCVPYAHEDAEPLKRMIIHDPVPRLDQFREDLPAGAQELVERAMAKNPFLRYSNAADLRRDVRELMKAQGWEVPVSKEAPPLIEAGGKAESVGDKAKSLLRNLFKN